MPIYKLPGKKDGLQRYRVRLNYVDQEGKVRQVECVAYGLENAKLLENELQTDKSVQVHKIPTLNQLMNEYTQSRRKAVRETTLAKSRNILGLHVLPELGEYRLDRLTMPVLQRWKNNIDESPLGFKTKKNIFGELRALLNYAVKMDYLPRNPLTKLGNFKDALQSGEHKIDYYTPEEFLKFIAAARNQAETAEANGDLKEWHYYVFFAIAFYTGLRKGEIHGLRWNAVNDGFLSVKCSVAQKLKGEDRITPPKNRSSIRTLQIPAPLLKILAEHKERCRQLRGFSESSFICGLDKSLRDSTIEHRNQRYAELAGVKKIRIHDFRHSHASLLANEGINIQEIARRLGHSKIEMTWNTYAHLYPREEERAITILDKIV